MSRPFDSPARPSRLPLLRALPPILLPSLPPIPLPSLPPMLLPSLLPLLLPALLFVSACSRPQTEFPISRDELPGVLIDVYVAEAEAELLGTDLTDARVDALRRRGYDTADFDETMRLLTEDPEFAKKIYQTVLDSVIFEQREIRAKRLTPPASLRSSGASPGRRSGQASDVGEPPAAKLSRTAETGRTSDSLAVEAAE